MPKTNEIAFNVRLLDVLQTKHPRWRDHVGVEQRDVLRETALQPDIVIRPPGGVPVIIETEFMPARSVEADATARLGKFLEYNGDLIEQTIAVQVPQELSRAPQERPGAANRRPPSSGTVPFHCKKRIPSCAGRLRVGSYRQY